MPTGQPQLILLILCFLLSPLSLAKTFSGSGYGDDMASARNEALSSLASSIYVQIESSSESYEDSKGNNFFKSNAQSLTKLPLFGTVFDCYQVKEQSFCSASINSASALPIYQNKITRLVAGINDRTALINTKEKSQHYPLLQQALSDYDQLAKYSAVVIYLSEHAVTLDTPTVSQQSLYDRLTSLEKKAVTLQLAAKLLARDIKKTNITIKPPALMGSSEITPFATALWQALKQELSGKNSNSNVHYTYAGQYQIHDYGIRVSYTLSDSKGISHNSHVIELDPVSYQHYRATALAPDFDNLLHKGYAVSSEMHAQISTNKGSHQLNFRRGETIQLLVKLNKAGYFYLAGHSKNKDGEISYLLDLNEASNNRRFVYYINADDVNKWVSLGEFETEAPFGLESLQLIASQNDLINALPHYQYDQTSGYYKISANIEKGVQEVRNTRGLKKKKQSVVADSTETVLLFTTQEKSPLQ